MTHLGNGLSAARHHEDALSVREAELAMLRRLGASEKNLLAVQGNLANTYQFLGRLDEALQLYRDVYSGRLKLKGEEDEDTLLSANNYATAFGRLRRAWSSRARTWRRVGRPALPDRQISPMAPSRKSDAALASAAATSRSRSRRQFRPYSPNKPSRSRLI